MVEKGVEMGKRGQRGVLIQEHMRGQGCTEAMAVELLIGRW